MWICDVFQEEKSKKSCYYLRGPSCRVGRKEDCDISFPTDKSVSRQHAEFLLQDEDLFIKDLGSKYCTSARSSMCVPNVLTRVHDGDEIKFGVSGSSVVVRRAILSLCFTRLEKSERDKLKQLSKALNATLVKTVEQCDLLICNKLSATLKVLTAIVYNKKIVTIEWMAFLCSSEGKQAKPFDNHAK